MDVDVRVAKMYMEQKKVRGSHSNFYFLIALLKHICTREPLVLDTQLNNGLLLA